MLCTADLCDVHPDETHVVEVTLFDLGGVTAFHGPIRTVKVFEDNVLVRQALESAGDGAVLVVDGGGSRRHALVGDQLAGLAIANGWAGIVVYGAIRDAGIIADLPLGVRATATCPKKSIKRGHGFVDVPLRFGGVDFFPGHWLYADADGVIVSRLGPTSFEAE